MAIFYTPIYTQTVGAGGAASVTFNNIPQTFTDLLVVASSRNSTSSTEQRIRLQFNANSENLHSSTFMDGTGSTAIAFRETSNNAMPIGYSSAANATSNTFGSSYAYIPNYTAATFKAVVADGVSENNATAARQSFCAGLWRKTDAVTAITIATESGTHVQGSTFSLYGVTRYGA